MRPAAIIKTLVGHRERILELRNGPGISDRRNHGAVIAPIKFYIRWAWITCSSPPLCGEVIKSKYFAEHWFPPGPSRGTYEADRARELVKILLLTVSQFAFL